MFGPIDWGTAHDMDLARLVHLNGQGRPSWEYRSLYTYHLGIHAHHRSLTRGAGVACDVSNVSYEV